IEDELLRASDCQVRSFAQNEIDYNAIIPFKLGLLKTAWANFSAVARTALRPAYEQFCHDQAYWLEDYALFRALKFKFHDAYYLEWPVELVRREPAAVDRVRRGLEHQLGPVCRSGER